MIHLTRESTKQFPTWEQAWMSLKKDKNFKAFLPIGFKNIKNYLKQSEDEEEIKKLKEKRKEGYFSFFQSHADGLEEIPKIPDSQWFKEEEDVYKFFFLMCNKEGWIVKEAILGSFQDMQGDRTKELSKKECLAVLGIKENGK